MPPVKRRNPRPPHSHPTSVTVAQRPSCGKEWGEVVKMFCPTAQPRNFSQRDWTAQISLNRFRKSLFRRRQLRRFVCYPPPLRAPFLVDHLVGTGKERR